MPFLETKTARIHYLLEGPENAQVLAFSNSLGANYGMWDSQADEFRRNFRVLRYDTRGHGESSTTPGPYSIELLGKDVLALLDALRFESVHFCGLSMGGMIGMWLALHASQRLKRLVLCNTAAKIGTTEGWNARIETVRTNGMKAIAPAVIERWFTAAFREKTPSSVAKIQKAIEDTNPEGYAACCAAVRDLDCRVELGTIRASTLVIAGASDPATPPADGRFLAAQIPGGQYAELNAAHLSNIEDRDGFNNNLRTFLEL
jgi:3-oxoadipate enol-lactonase